MNRLSGKVRDNMEYNGKKIVRMLGKVRKGIVEMTLQYDDKTIGVVKIKEFAGIGESPANIPSFAEFCAAKANGVVFARELRSVSDMSEQEKFDFRIKARALAFDIAASVGVYLANSDEESYATKLMETYNPCKSLYNQMARIVGEDLAG